MRASVLRTRPETAEGDETPIQRLSSARRAHNAFILSDAAMTAMRDIASLYEKTLPDLLQEGVNMVLAHYGHLPIKADGLVTWAGPENEPR